MSEDRVVLVTGGAKGIGLAIARRFTLARNRVVIADVDEEAGEKAALALGAEDGRAEYVRCDVSDKLSVRNLFAQIRSRFDRLDVCVNNAGIIFKADILSLHAKDFDRVLGTNLRGSFLVGQEAARQMIAQIEEEQPGRREALSNYAIVNVSSVNAVMAIPDQFAYVVSKGGMNQMTKAMALSLAPHGIRVNAVGPGSVNTDVLKAVVDDPEAKQRVLARTPLGHIGDPDEIAGVVMFLCSGDASYMTGQCLYADGGRLALNYTVSHD